MKMRIVFGIVLVILLMGNGFAPMDGALLYSQARTTHEYLDTSSTTPYISFKIDEFSHSLLVISADDTLDWKNVQYLKDTTWTTLPDHPEGRIRAGDSISCQTYTISLRWAPTKELLGRWEFDTTSEYNEKEYTLDFQDGGKTSQSVEPEWTYNDGSYVFSAAVSGNGEYFAVKTGDNVHFFDKDSSTPLWSKSTGNNMGFVAISSDASYIAVTANNILKLYNHNGGLKWSKSTGGYIRSVAISADGEFIVIGCSDNKVYFFDKDSSSPQWVSTAGDEVTSVDISDNGDRLVAGSLDSKVYYFDKDSSTPLWIYTDADGNFLQESVAIHPNGISIVAGDSDGDIYLFYGSAGSTPKDWYATGNCIRGIDIKYCFIAAGSENSNLYLFLNAVEILVLLACYDEATASYNEVCMPADGLPVLGACDSPDNHIRCPTLWHYQTGSFLRTVATSESGEQVVGGGNDKNIYFFDMNTITFYTDPPTGGDIIFDERTYQHSNQTRRPDGVYSITASPASGYSFDHWSKSGGIAIANPTSQSTTATITDDGTITAYFNRPPYTPSNPDPSHGETGVDINHNLYWDGGDPDEDTVYYDVYFGTDPTPDQGELVSEGQTSTSYDPGLMEYATQYYWKIVAEDEHGEPADPQGPIWSFTTEEPQNHPPYTPSNPDPYNGETGVDINHDLHWEGGDPDEDTVYYDVYFEEGDSTPDVKIFDAITSTSCDPGEMEVDTTYWWRIEAVDEHGEPADPQGPTWHFTTESEPTYPPTVDITYPENGQTVSGTVLVTGTADDVDGSVVYVEVRIDSGSWHTASGTTSWSYSWDTTSVSDGDHTISARSFDGDLHSEIDAISVTVENTPESLLIVHLTDPHIGATGAAERFGDVLQHVNSLHPDAVIISGDLVDWGCIMGSVPTNPLLILLLFVDVGEASYLTFNSLIEEHLDDDIQVYTCPGNHDYRFGERVWGLFWKPFWVKFDWSWSFDFYDYYLKYSLQNYKKCIIGNSLYETTGKNYYDPYRNTLIASLDSGHDTFDLSFETLGDLLGHIADMASGDWGGWADKYLEGTGLTENQIQDLDDWLDIYSSMENKIVFMHHPAVNEVRTISKNKDDFIQVCEDNGVEVVLTGHTHSSFVYDKYGNFNFEPDVGNPLYCNRTYYVQTQDCGKNHASYRMIEIRGDDVFIHRYNDTYDLINLYLTGPGDIHIYDQKGNHLGKNINGKIESEIHGATYGYLDTGEQFASLYYSKDEYRFEIEGNEDGILSLTLQTILKNGSAAIIDYQNITITNNTKIVFYNHQDLENQESYLYQKNGIINDNNESLKILRIK